MKYALGKVPKEDRYAVIKTCYIEKYSEYGPYTKNRVYRYDDETQRFKCLILQVSNSEKLLSDPNLRVREPVIVNPSSLESSDEDDDEPSTIEKFKAARKNQRQNELKSKKQRTEEIIKTYKTNREN
ncbi:hypothetical protein PV326_013859, partial [Microctonus aethiopoides]